MPSGLQRGLPASAAETGLDHLARRLAEPIGRRRAMAIFGGTMAALMLPPLRPRVVRGQGGATDAVICQYESDLCRYVECTGGDQCCGAPPQGESGCRSFHCCNPCDPGANKCQGDGTCGPGEIDNAACCRKQGGVPCGKGGCCFKPARGTVVCGRQQALCCEDVPPPAFCSACSNNATKGRAAGWGRVSPAYFCNAFDATCADASDREYRGDLGNCARVLKADPTAPPRQSNAYYYHPCFHDTRTAHTKRLMKCDRVPDHDACQGGECRGDTFTCCRYSGIPTATLRASAPTTGAPGAGATPPEDRPTGPEAEAGAAATGRVSRAELQRRVRRAEPRLARTRRRLFAAQQLSLRNADERQVAVDACEAHHRELLRLRRSVAAGRGGRPQRLLLRSYDATAAALLAYRDALAYSNRSEFLYLFELAGKQGARADALAKRALRTLK